MKRFLVGVGVGIAIALGTGFAPASHAQHTDSIFTDTVTGRDGWIDENGKTRWFDEEYPSYNATVQQPAKAQNFDALTQEFEAMAIAGNNCKAETANSSCFSRFDVIQSVKFYPTIGDGGVVTGLHSAQVKTGVDFWAMNAEKQQAVAHELASMWNKLSGYKQPIQLEFLGIGDAVMGSINTAGIK